MVFSLSSCQGHFAAHPDSFSVNRTAREEWTVNREAFRFQPVECPKNPNSYAMWTKMAYMVEPKKAFTLVWSENVERRNQEQLILMNWWNDQPGRCDTWSRDRSARLCSKKRSGRRRSSQVVEHLGIEASAPDQRCLAAAAVPPTGECRLLRRPGQPSFTRNSNKYDLLGSILS